MAVVIIPAADVLEDLLVVHLLPLLLQLKGAPAGALLRARGQEDLDLRVGQDDGADVPPVHQDIVLAGDLSLGLGQEIPHPLMGRDLAGCHRDRLAADLLRDVLPIEENVLRAVDIPQFQLQLFQLRQHLRRVGHLDPRPHHVQPDGAVERPGVHIEKAQLPRQPPGQ